MKEAFILDLNFLKEQDLSVIEFITLLQLNEIDTGLQLDLDILHNLQEKQFVKLIIDKFGTNTIIREKSKLLLDFLSIESSYSDYKEKKIIKKSNRVINEGFDEFIEEYRNLWKGLKSGAMGSPNACKEKMLRWMGENPNYTYEEYLGIIDISKINLYKGFYNKDSNLNNVKFNLYVLPESNYPDIKGGNLIIAGHSGNYNNSYFANLYMLEVNDDIVIHYNNKKDIRIFQNF